MSTLLLRLAGPMQSWGTQSRYDDRDTGLEPSKSGVIGLLCAALGRPRAEPVDDLAALRMGVRVDREGKLMTDFHTVGGGELQGEPFYAGMDTGGYGVACVGGKGLTSALTYRHYLADADFLVGLESEDDDLLRRLDEAIANPRWQLYLGRKSFVPGMPVVLPDGLCPETELSEALTRYPWPGIGVPLPIADFVPASAGLRQANVPSPWRTEGRWPARLRLILEARPEGGEDVRRDQPRGDAYRSREFGLRYTCTRYVVPGKEVPLRELPPATGKRY